MHQHILDRIARFWYRRSLGLLLIRLVAGLIFLVHGWEKVTHIPMVVGFFSMLGLPAWVALFIAWVEIICGLMLIFGVATRVAGAVLGIDMLVAILLTGIGRGFHAHEFELLLMAVSFGLALMGSGRWSLYKLECTRCGGFLCDGGATCTQKVSA